MPLLSSTLSLETVTDRITRSGKEAFDAAVRSELFDTRLKKGLKKGLLLTRAAMRDREPNFKAAPNEHSHVNDMLAPFTNKSVPP